jgi:spore coat protein A, manganese oxidase
MGMSRRQFLRRAGAGAGALAATRAGLLGRAGMVGGGGLAARAGAAGGLAAATGLAAAAPAAAEPFSVPLPIPRELTDEAITLVARPADVAVLDGPPTRMWTFDGTFPGPTIRRPSGSTTELTVVHQLPEHVGDLHVHNHGNHSAPEDDGVFDFSAVPVGGSRTYRYDHRVEGEPVGGRMQWYHDHTHHTTGRNVWMGLAGMFIVDDPAEADLGLPGGRFELPLLIADRRFDRDNQLVQRFTAPERVSEGINPLLGPGLPPFDEDAGVGDRVLVNGAPEPYAEVAARSYRLRILNASNFSPLRLRLDNGAPMVQVGTESGLLPSPVPRTELLLGPAERADVVVDFRGLRGQVVRLESTSESGEGLLPGLPVPRPATAAKAAPVLEFRVTEAWTAPVPPVARSLRELPGWVTEASPLPDRLFAFSLGVDEHLQASWVINGRAFSHDRIVARPELGSVETWALVNLGPTAMSHYIHLHGVDWTVVSRNGAPPHPYEAGLKETFRLDPGEVVLVAARFTDHLGKYVLHCHMLEHEDHGMMLPWEVVPAGAGDRRRSRPASGATGRRGGAWLDELVRGNVAGAAEQARVLAVLGAARGGQPAPGGLLRSVAGGAGVGALSCDLPL